MGNTTFAADTGDRQTAVFPKREQEVRAEKLAKQNKHYSTGCLILSTKGLFQNKYLYFRDNTTFTSISGERQTAVFTKREQEVRAEKLAKRN